MTSQHLKSIKWGLENGPKACTVYTEYMRACGHDKLVTRKCGFIVHPTMGCLGASPDAFVTEPSVDLPDGIAEFKCPFTKKDLSKRGMQRS